MGRLRARLKAMPGRHIASCGALFRRRPVFWAAAFYVMVAVLQHPGVLNGGILAPTDLLVSYPPWRLTEERAPARNTLRSDIVDSVLPTSITASEQLRSGTIPVWNDRAKQGEPLAQLNGTGLAYPTSVLYLALPPERAFTLIVLVRFSLLGLAMYVLLREVGLTPMAALVGGLVYQYQGFNVVWLFWAQVAVSGPAPLLLAALHRIVRKPDRMGVLAVALATLLLLAGGFPSVAAYFAVMAGVWFAVLAVSRRGVPLIVTGLALAGLALGVALMAFQLVPTLEQLRLTEAIEARSGHARASLDRSGMIQLVLPNQNGNSVFSNYQGTANFNEATGYVGVVGLLLACAGLVYALRTKRRVALFCIAGLAFSLIMVYRLVPPLVDLVIRLPVFDSNPNTRLLSVLGLSVAVLAGFGAELILTARRAPPPRLVRFAPALLLVATAAALLSQLRWFAGSHEEVGKALQSYPLLPVDVLRRSWALWLTLLCAGVAGFAILWLGLRQDRRIWLFGSLAALVLADGMAFSFRQNAVVEGSTFYPSTPGIEFLKSHARPNETVIGFDGQLFPLNASPAFGLASPVSHGFYSPAHKRWLTTLIPQGFVTTTAVVPQLTQARVSLPGFVLLGARYLVLLPGTEGRLPETFPIVYRGEDMVIAEDPRVRQAWLAPRIVRLGSEDAILERMGSHNFDPARVAFVVGDPAESTAPRPGVAAPVVELVAYEPGKELYRVESAAGGALVIPSINHPGWRAEVDGEGVPVKTFNLVYRGVAVPPGEHSVRFTFASTALYGGAAVSWVATFGVVLLLAWPALRWARIRANPWKTASR